MKTVSSNPSITTGLKRIFEPYDESLEELHGIEWKSFFLCRRRYPPTELENATKMFQKNRVKDNTFSDLRVKNMSNI